MQEQIKKLLIVKDSSTKETMQLIDRTGLGVAFVVDENEKLFGVVTDGDIRRAILKGIDINKPIQEIANTKPIVLREGFSPTELFQREIKAKIPTGSYLKVPVINERQEIRDVVLVKSNGKNGFQSLKQKPKAIKAAVQNVLIIGGAGYLGSVLSRNLLGQGYKVRVLDNLSYGDEGIKELYRDDDFEFLKGDIRDVSSIVNAIEGMDAVIHLAGIVGDPACAVDSKKTLEINYLATKSITETCKYFQINRFIFASTCSVYGQSLLPGKQLVEDSPLNPVSLYAETKIKCEQSILEAMDENFMPVILRMATLYGYSPHMRFDLAVNFLTAKALFDKKISIFGGEQWRPWLHLKDAAQAYISCLNEDIDRVGGKTFNVVSENYKVIDIGRIINSVCPEAKLEISEVVNDKRSYNISFDKISQALNYRPEKKVTDGIIEIKDVIQKGLIKDYKDPKYHRVLSV